MQLITETYSLKKANNEIINFDFRSVQTEHSKPLVIIFHGFKGFRKWGFIPYLSEKIAESGYFVVNPDFSLNGIVDSEKEIFDEEKFSRQTVSSELEDARYLIKYFLQQETFSKEFNREFNGEIILMGHSMGAAVSILAASEFSLVKKIVLLGTIGKLDRNTERQKSAWKESGFTTIQIQATSQKLKLNYEHLLDKEKNFPDEYLRDKAATLNIPVLLIHGSNDLTTRTVEAEKIFDSLKNKDASKLFIIKGTGHTFGIRHPLIEPGDAVILTLNEILTFIKQE